MANYNLKVELSKEDIEKLEACHNLEEMIEVVYNSAEFLNGYIDKNDISDIIFESFFGIHYAIIKIKSKEENNVGIKESYGVEVQHVEK